MSGEVVIATGGGCLTTLPNGAVGQVLGIQSNGIPGYINGGAGGAGGISTDAGNLLAVGFDGGIYIDNERVQDAVGAAIAAGLGLSYNDALNAISGALSIPVTSGVGVLPATQNSPTIYTDTLTTEIYYRDTLGVRVKVYSPTVSANANNLLTNGTDFKPYLSCEAVQDCIGTAIAAGLGLSYNDSLNAISGALAIPISTGSSIPPAVLNSPTILRNTGNGNVYYRDASGAVIQINTSGAGASISADAGNLLTTGTDTGIFLDNETIQDAVGAAIAAGNGGVSYNDATNAISGTLPIPITSGSSIPSATPNSPTIYNRTANGDIYYRDPAGSLQIIDSMPVSGDTDNLIIAGSDAKAYISAEAIVGAVDEAIVNDLLTSDLVGAVESEFSIPITSGAGVPPGTPNAPTIYRNTSNNDVYYRDRNGTVLKIGSSA